MLLGIVMLTLAVGFLGWTFTDPSLSPDLRVKLMTCAGGFLLLGLFFVARRFRGPRPDREERLRRRNERRGR